MRRPTTPVVLLLAFLFVWIVLAWAPVYRHDWALENTIVVVGVPWLVWGYRRVRFSNQSYILLFVFLVLHEIGAHYTYALVPYEQWSQRLLGISINDTFGFSRNNYDRLVHFLYGVLTTPALTELVEARSKPVSPLWRGFLPWCMVTASSAFFEILEWAVALLFGGALGAAYLGTQGDVWDAQWDMFLASFGSLTVVLWLNRGNRVHRS